MCVNWCCKAVVQHVRLGKVPCTDILCLGHAPRGEDANELVEVGVWEHGGVQRQSQRARGGDVHLHPHRRCSLTQAVKHLLRRRLMAPKQRPLRIVLKNLVRHRNIGHEHHLLHHLIDFPHLVHAHVHGVVRGGVDLELDLGGGQGERARLRAPLPALLSEPIHQPQASRDVVRQPRVVDARLGLLVGHRGARLDHSLGETHAQLVAFVVHLPDG
mmetsp:Transcript_44406/g.82948  ORF Transcript_44406/g.82948 Transcript_44406/m.82948 type:complete len:215 (-) Transcript_44406:611-1255(-)